MPDQTRRALLLAAVAGALPAHGHAAVAAAPSTVALLCGEALDEHGRQKPLSQAQRQLFDALQREMGIVFAIKTYPWARAERNALAGAGLIFGLPPTPERLRQLRYSAPAASNTLWLVTRSDATFPFAGLADLAGKTVGAVRGYSYGAAFEQARGKAFRVDDDIASRATRLARLMLRRVDVVLLYQPSTQSAAEVEAGVRAYMAPRLRDMGVAATAELSVLPQPLASDPLYFAIARGRDDAIIERIDAALARLRRRGEPVPVPVPPPPPPGRR
ncbi:substrate-binding periplasmic protein [Rugamonas sp. CCM 8940]|uniref:substrate-binding periplasmic protein n=1 Tax=Rugamonas sp. CCM 8940 TaxID=2765359 RepID=UPI0018F4E023|nr:transporter substrate-binding domain-containing protein [Rugamonas sp. CCM 8940]MBJ7313543.1 transporter substrate-binding domain-containing protein [Rugamonas sp. CCM 8940]